MNKQSYFYALGRRKTATARVRLSKGDGKIVVNENPAVDYFDNSKYIINELNKPFSVLEIDPKGFSVTVRVDGGGINGQVGAIQLGIAKALSELNEDYKGTLKKAGLLSRDPREKERKKFGLKKARKQRQFTKR
jgi:small subunit ribosomal protein S9